MCWTGMLSVETSRPPGSNNMTLLETAGNRRSQPGDWLRASLFVRLPPPQAALEIQKSRRFQLYHDQFMRLDRADHRNVTEVWTRRGLQRFLVLFFIDLSSRKVEIAGIGAAANGLWIIQIARNL